jgi:hypothetical protein
MQKLYIKGVYLALVLSMFSCGKDEISNETWTVVDEPNVVVESARMVTAITDENGKTVDGLTAAFNDTIRLVNKGDIFQFKGRQLNKRGEVLFVTDQLGNQYQFTQIPLANDVSYFHQVIIRDKPTWQYQSHQPLQLALNSQLVVNIAANQYRKSLQAYSGEVKVVHYVYDLNNENHRAALPGGITGFVKNGTRMLLEMKTAFDFTVKTPNGENIEFSSATLTSPLLATDLLLFHYNDASHHWEEVRTNPSMENERQLLQSGHYCIAKAVPYIQIKGRLMADGSPLPNERLSLRFGSTTQTLYTSNDGRWEGLVAAGVDVQYHYDLPCLNQQISVEPSNENIELPVDSPNVGASATQFIGSILDCRGQALSNGFIELKGQDYEKVVFLENPDFDFLLPHCELTELSLRAFYTETGETGPWIEWPAGGQNQLYNVLACSELKDNYLEVHSSNGGAIYTQLSQNIIGDRLELKAGNEINGANVFTITFPIQQKGLQPVDRINLVWQDVNFADKGIGVNCAISNSCGFERFDITHLPSQNGAWVRGQFKAKLWAKISETLQAGYVDVQGSFQFKRNF